MPKHITIKDAGPSASGKTKLFEVIANEGNLHLGMIKWFGRWRRYVFFPAAETAFEKDCLRDIADFIDQETRAHGKPQVGLIDTLSGDG